MNVEKLITCMLSNTQKKLFIVKLFRRLNVTMVKQKIQDLMRLFKIITFCDQYNFNF